MSRKPTDTELALVQLSKDILYAESHFVDIGTQTNNVPVELYITVQKNQATVRGIHRFLVLVFRNREDILNEQ